MGETNITKYVYIVWDSFGKPNLSYWFTDCLYIRIEGGRKFTDWFGMVLEDISPYHIAKLLIYRLVYIHVL